MKPVHPFPARMAPEILSGKLSEWVPKPGLVWDPMCGSGTTLRLCAEIGVRSFGSDTDPLAIKMASVATRGYDWDHLASLIADLQSRLEHQPWENSHTVSAKCKETEAFKAYWFAEPQLSDLTQLAEIIDKVANPDDKDFLHVAMSRIIITKFRGASLAWDVPHSRPHKKRIENDYQVIPEFINSCKQLINICKEAPITAPSEVKRADARTFRPSKRADLIMTSPPYLNAIDYLRGHKFSLVWMGWTIPQLRALRSEAVGTERRILDELVPELKSIEEKAVVQRGEQHRVGGIISRYIADSAMLMKNFTNSITPGGRIIIVVADSCVRGYTVKSKVLFEELAHLNGLKVAAADLRSIPADRRYLPTTGHAKLLNRMKEEWVLQFEAA